jgi:gamma-glutamyl hydrolase
MARAAIIPCQGSWENFTSVVSQVNGFLFTGMFTDYQMDNGTITGYGERGRYILDYVVQQNEANVWLPLFAECKGFNMVTFFVSGVPYWRSLIRDDIAASDMAAPIHFNQNKDYESTKIYAAAASTNSVELMTSGNNLYNRHNYGILPVNYSSNKNLTNFFGDYIATTVDQNGISFVSFVEHPRYPIYGMATHPEKVYCYFYAAILFKPYVRYCMSGG